MANQWWDTVLQAVPVAGPYLDAGANAIWGQHGAPAAKAAAPAAAPGAGTTPPPVNPNAGGAAATGFQNGPFANLDPKGTNATFITRDPETGKETIQKGAARYGILDPGNAWNHLTSAQIDGIKQQLYYAGGYYPSGAEVLLDGGKHTRDDTMALAKAMDEANGNGNASWEETIRGRYEAGKAAGKPFVGTKADGSDIVDPALARAKINDAAGKFNDTFDAFAYNNGIRLSSAWKAQNFDLIQSGAASQEQVTKNLRDTMVAGAFPAFAEQIKAGIDVNAVASPYTGAMESLLELPKSVDLFDPQVRTALQKGTGLADFENQLRSDSRWKFTQNANDQANNYVSQLNQTFQL